MIISLHKPYVFFFIIASFCYTTTQPLLELPSTWVNNGIRWVRGIQEITTTQEYSFDILGTLIIDNPAGGSITIKGWTLPKVMLEITREGSAFDIEHCMLHNSIGQQEIQLKTCSTQSTKASIHYTLMVPQTITLIIKHHKGTIKIKRLSGSIRIANKGLIELTDIAQSTTITNEGSVHARYKQIPLNSTITINATNDIYLYLPRDTNADLVAKAAKDVKSELFVTLKPITIQLNEYAWSKMKREVYGFLGNGGACMNLVSQHGAIRIFEY